MSSEPIHVISLGAGVQSSTMALMAAAGEITPMPACAIFADTQAEPASVYRWLEWLTPRLPFPVHRVTLPISLWDASMRVRTSKSGHTYVRTLVPAFAKFASGEKGMWWRKCTQEFKLRPLRRKARELQRAAHARLRESDPEALAPLVVQWIGISTDEAQRMKPARGRWITSRWPLIEAGMTRTGCLAWMQRHGYPRPPRSSCIFCPFHNRKEWLRLRDEAPEELARAAEFERQLQAATAQCESTRGTPYLHRSLRPLAEAAAHLDDQAEMFDVDGFGNECEGMCGV